MQILYETPLSCEQYVTQKDWLNATLSHCPNHPGGGCRFQRHGYYSRWTPYGDALIARYYCRDSHTTFSLLPVFFAAHMRGTLDEVEQVAVAMESDKSALEAARKARGAYRIEDSGMRRWALRRKTRVHLCVLVVVTMFADMFIDCVPLVTELRRRLGTDHALIEIRRLCADHLQTLPVPVGFRPP